MQSELKLKLCPMCGSSRVGIDTERDTDGCGVFLSVSCRDCRTHSGQQFSSEPCPQTYQEVRDAWNRRAGSDAVPERQAALAEVRAEVREMQDNLETFGEYGRETARVALDGVLDRIDELAAAPAPAPESEQRDDESVVLRDAGPARKPWFGPLVKEIAQSEQPERGELPEDKGPWSVGIESDDCVNGVFLESADFTHDVRLYVNGDFEDQAQRKAYAEGIARKLNAASKPAPESELSAAFDELAKQQERLDPEFARILDENRDDLYIAQADQTERGELPELLEELFALIEGAPELNMSNYNDDDVSELNASIIEIYQVAQKVKAALSATKPAPVDDGLFNLATDAWSRSTDAAWDSDGLTAVIRALTTPAPVDWEAERERFHLWVKSKGGSVIRRDGSYIESMTQLWWVCWKARAALATAGGDEKPVGYASAYMLNLFAKGEADFVSVFRSQPESMKPVALYTRPDSSRLAEAVRKANAVHVYHRRGYGMLIETERWDEIEQALAQYEGKE